MANVNKFVDRSPCLKPAGVTSSITEEKNVSKCLVQEISENELHLIDGERRKPIGEYNLPPWESKIYKGWYTDVRECLQPELYNSLFDVLSKEFKETVYDSYWKKEVGRVPDPIPMLPAGMDHKKVCFGKPSASTTPAGELINPPKSYSVVMAEAEVGHDMYKKTHQDYAPGEQIGRNYVEPFHPGLVWGNSVPWDPQGGCIKKVLNLERNDKILVSKILADYRKRNKSLIGKVLAPNDNVECVPKNHAFGKCNKRELYGAAELMSDYPPSLEKVDLFKEVSHINVVRNNIAKRKPPFPHRDFRSCFHLVDSVNSGILHMDDVYRVLTEFSVFPDKQLFEALLTRLNILSKDRAADYEKIADILNLNVMFPNIEKIHDIPNENLQFVTTNQIAHKYHSNGNINSECSPAGTPSGKKISIRSMISPDIFTNYFLEPEDFLVSRTPDYIRTLFGKINCEMDDTTFEKLWKYAQDDNGCVSVQSFLNALKLCK